MIHDGIGADIIDVTITHIDNFALKLELPTDTVLSAPAEEFAPWRLRYHHLRWRQNRKQGCFCPRITVVAQCNGVLTR